MSLPGKIAISATSLYIVFILSFVVTGLICTENISADPISHLCEPDDWLAEFGVMGTDGDVHALVHYDGKVVLAGQFGWAGTEKVANIACWDGAEWSCPGGGLHGYESKVLSMVVDDGLLIVGGMFNSTADGPVSNLAIWDGQHWSGFDDEIDGQVSTLLIDGDNLLIGGDFSSIGDMPAGGIAVRDDSTWLTYGSGFDGEVKSLAFHNNQLIAGGRFMHADGATANHIALWNGSGWEPLGQGLDDDVHAVISFQDVLIAGGKFLNAGGAEARSIARWDNDGWSNIPNYIFNDDNICVNALVEHHDELLIAGRFYYCDQYNGPYGIAGIVSWSGVGYFNSMEYGLHGEIFAVTDCGGDLYTGGAFSYTGSYAPASRIARWDSQAGSWLHLGEMVEIGNNIFALTEFQGHLIAGRRSGIMSGGMQSSIARWDGHRWNLMSENYDGGRIYCFDHYQGELIAGGRFYWMGGEDCQGLGRWDGNEWNTLGDGLYYDIRYGPAVMSSCVWDGNLVVGGVFWGAADISTPNVALWDGAEWHGMGAGLPEYVTDLDIYQDDLYACHNNSESAITRWDDGLWNQVGGSFLILDDDSRNAGTVTSLVVYDDQLIAGGFFTHVDDILANDIARWNGLSWEYFIPSPGGRIRDLQLYANGLIAIGEFAEGIKFWNGEEWTSLNSGLSPADEVLSVYSAGNGDLYAGGSFAYAGDKIAFNVAHWKRGVTAVQEDTAIPPATQLGAFSPNPLFDSALSSIRLSTSVDSPVLLTIHDLTGRCVNTLFNQSVQGGEIVSVNWDGRDSRGVLLPAGIYYARLKTDQTVRGRKITIVQ